MYIYFSIVIILRCTFKVFCDETILKMSGFIKILEQAEIKMKVVILDSRRNPKHPELNYATPAMATYLYYE